MPQESHSYAGGVKTPESCLAQAGRTSVHCVLSPDSRGRALCVNISTIREVVDRRRSGAPNGLHRHWHCAQKASLGASEQRDNPGGEIKHSERERCVRKRQSPIERKTWIPFSSQPASQDCQFFLDCTTFFKTANPLTESLTILSISVLSVFQ